MFASPSSGGSKPPPYGANEIFGVLTKALFLPSLLLWEKVAAVRLTDEENAQQQSLIKFYSRACSPPRLRREPFLLLPFVSE